MKILFLIRCLDPGGAQRQLISLANYLAQQPSWQVHIAVFYDRGLLEPQLHPTIALHHLGKKHRWDLLSFCKSWICTVRKINPDIIHSYLGGANLLACGTRFFLRHTPKPKIILGLRHAHHYSDFPSPLEKLILFLESLGAKYADRVIANSQTGAKVACAQGFPEKKLAVIPNGINTKQFYIARDSGSTWKHAQQIPTNIKIIGCVARLDPVKNHELLLRSFARLIFDEGIPAYLVCVGDGPLSYRQHLETLCEQLEITSHVKFVSHEPEIEKAYNAFDVICLSSENESFANVIPEAMACGVPFVSTRVGDLPAYLSVYGGTFVETPTEEALTTALKKTLQTHYKPETIREHIINTLSVERLGENTIKQLEQLFIPN